ncbi:MAG: hypothetical protein AABX38_02445 [Candidatus Micrarchaeota archaeon]
MIVEIIIGVTVGCIVLYFLWNHNQKIINYEKAIENGKTNLKIHANKDLKKLTIKDVYEGQPIEFVRKNIESGEDVEFTYPKGEKITRIFVEEENGKKHEIECTYK